MGYGWNWVGWIRSIDCDDDWVVGSKEERATLRYLVVGADGPLAHDGLDVEGVRGGLGGVGHGADELRLHTLVLVGLGGGLGVSRVEEQGMPSS